MNAEIKVDDLLIADQNSVKPELKHNIAATAETRLPSAQLLQDTDVMYSASIPGVIGYFQIAK